MADAADLMTSIIGEQGSTPLPEPVTLSTPDPVSAPPPPAAPLQSITTEGLADSELQDDSNWYEHLLAEQNNDPVRALLLDDTAWGAMQANPLQLGQWATNARTQIQQIHEREEELKRQEEDFEWFGGRANAGRAARLAGDLFRGEEALPDDEALKFGANGPRTYAERALHTLLTDKDHARVASELGVTVLNMMPGLLQANEDYLLHVLGYDPKLKADFKNVIQAGGYKPQADHEAVQGWFQANQIPLEYIGTFHRLPVKKQHDMLAGDVEAARFDLEQYHEKFSEKEQREQQARQAETQAEQELTQRTTRDLALDTAKIFDEYVEKGKAMGLNQLEAAGAAAMAYKAIEQGYWDDGTDTRRTFDNWFTQMKDGNKFQAELSKKSYKKLFEQEYRKALGQYQPKRPKPPVPSPGGQKPATPANGNQQSQFDPSTPPNEARSLTPEELMTQVMRDYGVIR